MIIEAGYLNGVDHVSDVEFDSVIHFEFENYCPAVIAWCRDNFQDAFVVTMTPKTQLVYGYSAPACGYAYYPMEYHPPRIDIHFENLNDAALFKLTWL